jgi:nitrite reductase (NADH) large subunit
MNTTVARWAPETVSAKPLTKIVVIGAGPVGVRFIDELKKKHVPCQVTLFGDEPYEPYNRVQLSHLLSREKDYEDIVSALPLTTDLFQFRFEKQCIERIDPDKQVVSTKNGSSFDYDYLIIATGSKPHVPNIEGVNVKGVYTFRNLRDAEALIARSFRSRRTVVVGGGLLGLEAAHALTRHNTEVILVQQSDRLMNRQLDEGASSVLEDYVKKRHIDVITSSGVRKVIGQQRVEGVVLRDGNILDCDTVLFCTGIKPATSLAIDAGLSVGQGITVNDHLQTSKENIFAIGECAEHQGMIYGIVSPGLEQAAVLADRLANGKSNYQGTQIISTLKVVGKPVCSMGEVAEVTRRAKQNFFVYKNKKSANYRKLVIHQGKLIGACAVGDWPESRRVQEAFHSQSYIYPWQQIGFLLTGRLWFGDTDKQVASWPESAVICQCNQITRGTISEAVENGCNTIDAIGKQTAAGTVCGSCQPLLQNLTGADSKPLAIAGAIPILLLSIFAAIIAALFVLIPGVEPVDSVQTPSWEFLWTDGYWKQVSGFSLVGIVALGSVMSLRKRAGWKFLGNFSYWRILHVVLGLLALAVLLIHTGAHLGENLNRWLMLNFLLVSGVGALAGITLSLASKTSLSTVQTLKKSWYWAHLLVVWPLPALLIVHVLSVYFF